MRRKSIVKTRADNRARGPEGPISPEVEGKLLAQARAGELAWGGTPVFGGLVGTEYVAELQGQAALTTATRMRMRDPQVRAVTRLLSLPIQANRWFVAPPKGAGSAETEAAELLEGNLFGGMLTSFDDLIREATLAMYFGVRVPELVWEERAGLIALRKIASRNVALIRRWLYDQNGELVGYLYRGAKPVGTGVSVSSQAGTQQTEVAVPIEKTLHFVYEQENDNPEGFGLWRSMYLPEYVKYQMIRIMGIGIERNLLGIPVARMEGGAKRDDRAEVLRMLKRLRAAEDAAVALPFGWVLEWFESQRSTVDALPFLQFMDAQIARVALAQFINLGTSGVGTQALASEHVRVFLDAEEAAARWVEQTLNAQLVRRWCLVNYGPELRCPEIRHRKIEHRSLQEWAQALKLLIEGRLITPGVEDEEQVRDLTEMAAIPREQLETRRSVSTATAGDPLMTGPGSLEAEQRTSARG